MQMTRRRSGLEADQTNPALGDSGQKRTVRGEAHVATRAQRIYHAQNDLLRGFETLDIFS